MTLKLINEPSVSNQDLCTANNNNNKCTEVQLAEDGGVEEHFVTGNVTFVPIPRLTSGYYHRVHYYFRYLFNGPGTLLPQEEVCSQQPNLTREYTEVGRYNYTVHAIALVNKVLAHHAKYSGYLNLFGKFTRAGFFFGVCVCVCICVCARTILYFEWAQMSTELCGIF